MKNICVAKNYEKNWEKKTQRLTIGRLIEKDWKQYVALDCIPTNWDWFASVFEQEKKESPADNLPF